MAKTKPVDIGTKAETKVVNWAKTHELWGADRLTKTGASDRGDVRLVGSKVMVQVKSGYTEGREPSDYLIAKWLDAVDLQVKQGGWEIGMLCHHRAGKGNPDMWRWYLTGNMFRKLVAPLPLLDVAPFPQYVQLQGYMIPPLLRNAGFYA